MSEDLLPELIGADLTPWSRYESLGCCIAGPLPRDTVQPYDKSGIGHLVVNRKFICQNPKLDTPSSLTAYVTCKTCRDYWHFKITPDGFRPFTEVISRFVRVIDANSCNCLSCKEYLENFFYGKSCN